MRTMRLSTSRQAQLAFPKAILHNHESLMHAARVEQNHHGQTKEDVFPLYSSLYHTGAKMHWFGSLISGGKAVLLKGVKPEFILDTVSKGKVYYRMASCALGAGYP